MNKHTPGPWRMVDTGFKKSKYAIVAGDDYIPVAEVFSDPAARRARDLLNVCLIAAAPDLLKALKEVVAIYDHKHDALTAARMVIAQAEGRWGPNCTPPKYEWATNES